MHSSISNFERVIPTKPWRGITVSVVMTLAVATAAWEIYCRSLAYGPSLNDTGDLWAEARRRVEPESLVIVGDSRALFDSDLDRARKRVGQTPGATRAAWKHGVPSPVRFDQRHALSRHHHLQRRPETVFRAAGFAADESFGKIGAPIPHPDVCPTRESRSRHLSREMVRLHEAGRPDAWRAS